METLEPKPITRTFWVACIAVPLVAVCVMIGVLLNPEWLSLRFGKGEPLNVSFTVPGEFSPRSLSDFRGRVIVVTLWRTTDCPECPAQLSALHDLSVRYGRDGLMAIGLSSEDSLTIAQYPQLREMAAMSAHIEKIQADVLPAERPYTYVIDREGLVRKKISGGLPSDRFDGLIERLLGR